MDCGPTDGCSPRWVSPVSPPGESPGSVGTHPSGEGAELQKQPQRGRAGFQQASPILPGGFGAL